MPLKEVFLLFETASEDGDSRRGELSFLMWAGGSSWKRGTTAKKFYEQLSGTNTAMSGLTEKGAYQVLKDLKQKQQGNGNG
jgi:hypothetical protein